MPKTIEYDVRLRGVEDAAKTIGDFEKKAEGKEINIPVKFDHEKVDKAFEKIQQRGENIEKVGQGIAGGFAVATGVIGAFGDSMGISAETIEKAQSSATSFIAIMTGLKPVIEGARAAMALFNAVMLANPIGLVAVAIAAVIAGLVALYYFANEINGVFSEMNTTLRIAIDIMFPFIGIIDLLTYSLSDAKEETKALTEAEKKAAEERAKEIKRVQEILIEGNKRKTQLQEEVKELINVEDAINSRYDAEIAAARAAGIATGELEAQKRIELKKTYEAQVANIKAQIDNAITTLSLAKRISTDEARQLIENDALFGRVLEQAETKINELNNKIGDIVDKQKEEYKAYAEEVKKQNEIIAESDRQAIEEQERYLAMSIESIDKLLEADLKRLEEEKKAAEERARLDQEELQRNIEKHQQNLDFAKMVIDSDKRSYDDKLQALKEYFEKGEIYEDEYNQFVKDAKEKRTQDRLDEANKAIGITGEYYDSLSSINDSINQIQANGLKEGEQLTLAQLKRQFVRSQSLAILNAAINGGQAVTKAIAEFGPPPSPAGIAGIISALAVTGAQIAAIASKKFEGAGASGGSQLSSAPSLSQQTPNTQSIAFNQTRPDIQPKQSTIRVAVLQSDIKDETRRVDVAQSLASFG